MSANPHPDRPNVLFIMTDQQRGDCLGCDGHPVQETPYLDQLASQGTRFRCAYTATPSCLPARATLLTGMNQWHTGILGMGKGQGPVRSDYRHTMPGELAAAGYHTQAVGKNHFNPQRALNGYHGCILDESGRMPDSDFRRWFDAHAPAGAGYRDHSVDWNSWMARPSHLPEYLHPTHWTAHAAYDWLTRRDPEKPFFLKVSFARPHSPYEPPQPYWDMYKDRDMPEPYTAEWSDNWHRHPDTQDDTNAWRATRNDVENQRARVGYYGSITFIDHQIGWLLQEFRKLDAEAARNTLIIFCSDHGDMMGDHHLWRKTYAYEGSARVPMIVKPPDTWDCPRGQVLDHVVELRDVMPTVLDAAGVDIPDTVDGQSMVPLLRGQAAQTDWRDYLIGEHIWCYSHEQANYYVTDGKQKYIWFPYLGREQLFDLVSDRGETRDLASDNAWQKQLGAWRARLVEELTARDNGLVRNGELVTLSLDDVITSPHYGRYNCASAEAEATPA
ncbi:MAG: arylsulfatase [Phycisphaeraceae bacterium]